MWKIDTKLDIGTARGWLQRLVRRMPAIIYQKAIAVRSIAWLGTVVQVLQTK